MSAGFEARARITADVSGFVNAARSASAASRQLGVQTRTLRNDLAALQVQIATAATTYRRLNTALSSSSSAHQSAAQASSAAAAATRSSAAALGNQQQAATAAASSTRQHTAATSASTAVTAANRRALQSVGQQMVELSTQRRTLMAIQRQQGQLDAQQVQRLMTLRQALRALGQQYAVSSAAQRAYIDMGRAAAQSAQQQASAANAAAASMRQVGAANNAAAGGINEFNSASNEALGRLWALRSAGDDLAQGLQTMAFATRQAFTTVWQVFSQQEQTIAHFSRITQESDANVQGLASSIRDLAGEIPLAFQDLGQITILGAQVGIANSQLASFTETVARFSETTPVAAEEAAKMFARITEMTDIDESQIRNLGAAVSELGSNSAATEGEILRTIESIAVVSSQAGLASTSILGLGAAMASLRVRPELARGAMQRVMHNLGEAAQGASAQTNALAETMGMTREEVSNLQATDPDQFFFSLLESLNQTATGAGDLTSTLRELGIINTRDIDTISRLAANYDLLDQSVAMANRSFSEGTFLQQESERIFNTLTSRVQILRNEWANFAAMSFEAAAPLIGVVVDLATSFARLLQALDPVSTTIVGMGIALTGLAAILSTVGAAVTRLGIGYVAFRGIQNQLTELSQEYNQNLDRQRASAMNLVTTQSAVNSAMASGAVIGRDFNAATARTGRVMREATNAQMGMVNALTASNTAVANGAVTGRNFNTVTAQTGRTMTQAANAVAFTTTNMQRMRSGMAVAATAARNLWTAVWPMAAIAAGIVAIGAIGTAFQSTETRIRNANQQFIQAAGGMDALTSAILEDTAAMNTMLQMTDRSASTLAFRTDVVRGAIAIEDGFSRSSTEAANALEILESSAGMTAGQIKRAADEAGNADPELQGMAEQVRELEGVINGTSDSVNGMNVAFGEATHQFFVASAQASAMESDILQSGEAFDIFSEQLEQLGGISTIAAAELTEAGAGAEALRQASEDLRQTNNQAWIADGQGWLEAIENTLNLYGMLDWATGSLTSETTQAANALDDLADNFDANTLMLDEATNATELFNHENVALADGTVITTERLRELGVQGHMMAQEIMPAAAEATRTFGVTVEDLSNAFAGFVNPVTAWNEAMEGTTGTSEAAGQALIDMQTNASQHFGSFVRGMENMQTAQIMWAENLLQLSGRVPDEVLAGLAEMGTEGAGIVAGLVDANDEQVQRFVNAWESGGGMLLEEFSHTFSSFMRMARDAGDNSGQEFALGLLQQVRSGDITFRDAVNEMTDYAEREFEGADPTMEAHLQVVDAINELGDLMRQVLVHFDIIDEAANVTPTIDDGPFRGDLFRLAEENYSAFQDMQANSDITPDLRAGNFRGDLFRLAETNYSAFQEMQANAEVDPDFEEDEFRGDLFRLAEENQQTFAGMEGEASVDPDLESEEYEDGLDRLYENNLSTFLEMRDFSWVRPDLFTGGFLGSLSNLHSRHNGTISSMRSSSSVSPRLHTGGFISGLSSLLGAARYYASLMRSALTVSPTITGGGGGFSKLATGGWVTGPGGPRADAVPVMASAGEFVVNARSAAAFGPLLEAINRAGTTRSITPDFVPADIMTRPHRPIGETMPSAELVRALQGVRDGGGGAKINVTVNNTYPQAEPTSITVNRALAYVGVLDGVS